MLMQHHISKGFTSQFTHYPTCVNVISTITIHNTLHYHTPHYLTPHYHNPTQQHTEANI